MGMPLTSTMQTRDVVQLAEATQPWELHIEQLTRGQWLSTRETVHIGKIILYQEHFQQGAYFSGCSPPGYYMIGTSLSRESATKWLGQELGTQRLACVNGNDPLNFIVPRNSTNMVMLVPEYLLPELHKRGSKSKPKNTYSMEISHRAGQRFIELFGAPLRRYIEHPKLLLNPLFCSALEHTFLSIIKHCLNEGTHYRQTSKPTRGWKTALKGLEYFGGENQSYSSDALVGATGVSERTLQYAFKDTFGVTPIGYDHLRRLNEVHHDLYYADHSTVSVAKLANQRGFSELGRFSQEYASTFHELPSCTLRRHPDQSVAWLI